VGAGEKELRAVAFVGNSGAGKTTLLEKLVPALRELGFTVGCFKGTHHDKLQFDREGKDTDRLFRSGAERVLIASENQAALRIRLQTRNVHALLAAYFSDCDLVLVEGFKSLDLPRIEIRHGEPLLPADRILAVISDTPDPRNVPCFARDDVESIARFVAGTMTAS
jgi:molybdopterin-guanine dinucleotide biosynthesis protein B